MSMTNQEHIYQNLDQLKTLEQQIEKAGIGTVKPLAKKLAYLSRQTFARLAVEVFKNE